MAKFADSGIAAAVFLAIYSILLPFMCFVLFKKGFKSVYTFIFFFVLFRFGAQLCGVVYAKIGASHWQWLIAYLVLGAEGYFSLILASLRFTCRAQIDAVGHSWALETGPGPFGFFILRRLTKTWVGIFHLLLIPANAFLIAGGSMLAGIQPEDLLKETGTVNTSKGLRTAGQVIFLLMTIALFLFAVWVFFKERIRSRTVVATMCAGPFLMVRGIFGILSIYITSMNYYSMNNYTGDGINHKLIVYEYVLGTSMELIAALLILSRFFVDSQERRPQTVHHSPTDVDKLNELASSV